jgi:hypothetical protein
MHRHPFVALLLCLAGCGGSTTASDGGSDGSAGPAGSARLSADHEAVEVNSSDRCPAATTVRISNLGGEPSGPLDASLTGLFTIGANSCQGRTLAPAESCPIEVVLGRNIAGQAEGMLTVHAQPGGEVTVRLRAQVFVAEAPSPVPSTIDFGSVQVGDSSPPRTVTLSNTGSAAGMLFQSTVEGSDFVELTDTCSNTSLPSGQTCAITVAFRPTSIGVKTGSVTFEADGSCRKVTSTVPMTGSGLAAPDAGSADAP